MKVELEYHQNFPATSGYATFIKYYPVRFKVEAAYEANRQVVYNFKSGIANQAVDDLFVSQINNLTSQTGPSNFWLCCLPSSKVDKTNARFKNLITRLSDRTKVNNGFDLLKPNQNRNEVHTGNSRDYSNVLSSIDFGHFQGKRVILIDDVVTTGRSFGIVAGHLRTLHCTRVNGLMLAKTHWLQDQIVQPMTDSNTTNISHIPPIHEIADDLPF